MRRWYVIAGALFLLGFVLLSKYEDRPAMRALDFAVTVKVQERIDRTVHLRTAAVVGNLMQGATFFAGPVFTSLAVLALAAFSGSKGERKRRLAAAMIILVGFALIAVTEIYGKSVVHHPSPPFSMIKHPTTVFPADYINEQFSYPSGHAARAVYIAMLLYWTFILSKRDKLLNNNRLFRWGIPAFCAAYVLLVTVSRVYLGHHWFSDIAGGLFLGTGIALLSVSGLVWNRSVSP